MRVLVVHAHPVPDSLGAALRDRAVAAARAAGHEVDLLDLHADGFDPVLGEVAWRRHGEGVEAKPDIAEHARRLRAADALVVVHPTWWGGPPAVLKGWLDRVWTTGVAYELPPGATRIRGTLPRLRRVVVVTTHGSSRRVNILQGEPGRLLWRRGLRVLLPRRARVRWVALYGVDRADDATRRSFLDRVERVVSRL